jgi:hypothetical protein
MKFWPVILLLAGCSLFISGPDQPKTAKETRYKITYVKNDWFQKFDNKSDYVFENAKDARIFLSNSFCDEFQEQKLDRLAKKIFDNIKDFKLKNSQYITFKKREAFKGEGVGLVDGVKVHLIIMNTRRNNCYFDFISITPSNVVPDSKSFEEFLDSVEFK